MKTDCSVVTKELLDKAAAQTREEIYLYCKMENNRPFTMNVEEYNTLKEERVTQFALLRHAKGSTARPFANGGGTFTLHDPRGNSHSYYASEDNLLTVLSAYGLHLSSAKELVRIYADEYDAELGVISHVAAYFEVASKRVIDDIPKVFETVFAREFGERLGKVLIFNLKLVGDGGLENCARYIRDEPTVRARREDLTRQQEILNRALDTVSRFFK